MPSLAKKKNELLCEWLESTELHFCVRLKKRLLNHKGLLIDDGLFWSKYKGGELKGCSARVQGRGSQPDQCMSPHTAVRSCSAGRHEAENHHWCSLVCESSRDNGHFCLRKREVKRENYLLFVRVFLHFSTAVHILQVRIKKIHLIKVRLQNKIASMHNFCISLLMILSCRQNKIHTES